MVKSRMTALDVRATVEEMRATLVGLRLQKIYNINNKMFLFKFGEGENKKSVLLENGVRFHLTELAREKPKLPSQFVMKLRKHIRSWRLDSIVQLQHDRTVDLCFGVAGTEGCFHIIVELFSKGNVILTDYTYKMMMLLRTHRDDEGLNLMVNAVYPITAPFAAAAAAASEPAASSAASAAPSITSAAGGSGKAMKAAESSKNGETGTGDGDDERVVLYPHEVDSDGVLHRRRTAMDDADLTPAQQLVKVRRTEALKAEWDVGMSRSDERTNVQALVAGVRHFGPDLAQHVITLTGVANAQRKSWTQSPDDVFAQLLPGLLEAYDLARVDLASAGGFLIKQKAKAGSTAPSSSDAAPVAAAAAPTGGDGAAAALVAVAVQYESFTPILLAQYTAKAGQEVVYRPSFGRVCDDFFLITETERIDASNEKRAKTAKSKEDKFATDHARRINTLESDIAANQHKGEQLILNADRVDEAIQLINGALATGISWEALRSLLKRRHAEGHPVAYMIHDLFLERNSISVLLEQALDEEEGEEDCDVPPLVVEVALSKTAHANAAEYFGKQKQHRSKLERTVAATDKAAAGAARKGARKAAEHKEKKVIVKERQRGWWEKFYWFRTSGGDLVLRGRDVQSTELLVRRVMRLGDHFIHCDVDGSLPCLLRPMSDVWQGMASGRGGRDVIGAAATQPVALHSLQEAGAWCVAFSGAWESKQSTGSWWVYASQVTGGTATGTYLYSGERHHLPPQPMPLGCALLFYVTRSAHEPPAAAPAAAAAAADGEREEGEEEAGAVGDAESSAAPPSPFAVLRRELPSLLAPPSAAEAAAFVPPDPATALAELPSVEALRAEQRKQHQTYTTAGAAGAPARKGKAAKKGGGARNSRVDREGLRGAAVGAVAVLPASAASAALEDSVITASAVSTAAGTAGAALGGEAGKRLTKHQKKKLKKIHDKYGDQDDEDRMLGAQVNGNQLSRVQLLELERQAEQRQLEEAAQRAQDKTARAAQRAAGTLRYRHVAGDGSDGESGEDGDDGDADDAEEGVEEVSDFTDDDDPNSDGSEHGAGAADAGAGGAGDAEEAATDAQGEEGEERPESESGAEPAEDEEEGAAAAASTTAGSRNDREAAVAQQAAVLARAFGHYTMRPGPADCVQHVVAVCAPMMVLSAYAYHATLCMGNTKKGVLAGKLLQVFTAQAEQGEGASRPGTAGAPSAQGGKKNKKAATGPGKKGGPAADAAATPPVVNASLVKALQMTSANDVVEQLRANVKPVDFRV